MLLAVSFENELLSLIVLILTDHARLLVLSTLVDVSRQIKAACADYVFSVEDGQSNLIGYPLP